MPNNVHLPPICGTPHRYAETLVVCRGEKRSEVHDYTNRGVETGKEAGRQAISCSYPGYYERHALRIYLPTFPRDICT